MSERAVLKTIMKHGAIRGSEQEFAAALGISRKNAGKALISLERKGLILKATPLPGSRPVYSCRVGGFVRNRIHTTRVRVV